MVLITVFCDYLIGANFRRLLFCPRLLLQNNRSHTLLHPVYLVCPYKFMISAMLIIFYRNLLVVSLFINFGMFEIINIPAKIFFVDYYVTNLFCVTLKIMLNALHTRVYTNHFINYLKNSYQFHYVINGQISLKYIQHIFLKYLIFR